jgi:probable F420-dependent oxidoreductase
MTAATPFRFAVQAYKPTSGSEWRDTARKAEDLGYSALHLADHYFGEGPALAAASHPLQTVAAIPAMMAAAAATESLKVGSRVMCCDYHQPMVLMKSLATIDLLSDGRLEAGFGAGWTRSEYDAMGVPWERAGKRIAKMAEYVEFARQFFAGVDLDYRGEYVQVHDTQAVPASPQPGGPKIMIGGGAPKVLGIAGRLADIVSINFNNAAGKIGAQGVGSGTAEGTAEKIGWIRDGAGDRFDDIEIEIAAYFTTVTDNTTETTAAMAGAFGLEPDVVANHPHTLIGSVEEIIEKLQARRAEFGISYVTVGDSAMDDFAPVVAALTGT